MRKLIAVLPLAFAITTAHAQTGAQMVCSYAPSQSKTATSIVAAGGGAGATAAAVAQATGLSVVAHSSGGYILTGSAGYVAGTLGGAITGPVIIAVGAVVAGVAVTVELVCAPKNHPDEVAKVLKAADDFAQWSKEAMKATPGKFDQAKKGAVVVAKKGSAYVEKVTGDVYEYAYCRAKPGCIYNPMRNF